MKDKLRELAERWNGYGGYTYRYCAEQLLAILDAEGDGGAVSCQHDWAEGYGVPAYCNHCGTLREPARSGVVSDEDVRDAVRYRWLRGRNVGDGRLYKVIHDDAQPGYQGFKYEEELDQAIDAAIQGERHER